MNVVLPKKARLITYITLAVIVGLALPAVAVWFTSVGDPIPMVLVRIQAIASFVVAAPLTLAALNINSTDPLVNAKTLEAAFNPETAPVNEQAELESNEDEEPDEDVGLDVILAPKE